MSKKKPHDVSQTIPDKHSTQRRKLLKTLAAGGVAGGVVATLPETWTRPIVDSVLLPVHAQASVATLSAQISYDETFFDPGTYNAVPVDDGTRTYSVFVTPAQAIPVTLVVTGIDADRGDDDSGAAGDSVRTVSGTTDPAGTFSFLSSDQDDTGDGADVTLSLVASSSGLASSSVTINWV